MDTIHPQFYAGLDTSVQAFVACKTIPNWTPPNDAARVDAARYIVAQIYGVDIKDVVNPPDRRMVFVEARAMLSLYLRLMDYSYARIGQILHRNHASVIHNVKKMMHVLDAKHAPERAGFIQLLFELGHLPMLMLNTHAGTRYMHELFSSRRYSEFMHLNLAYYELLSSKIKTKSIRAKLKNEPTGLEDEQSFATLIKQEPLNGLYMRSPDTSKRVNVTA